MYLGHPGRSREDLRYRSRSPEKTGSRLHTTLTGPLAQEGRPARARALPASLAPLALGGMALIPARQPGLPSSWAEPSLAAFGWRPSRAALSCAEFSTQHGFIIQKYVLPDRPQLLAGGPLAARKSLVLIGPSRHKSGLSLKEVQPFSGRRGARDGKDGRMRPPQKGVESHQVPVTLKCPEPFEVFIHLKS